MKKASPGITLLDIKYIAEEEALKPWKAIGKFLFLVFGIPLVGLVLDILGVGIVNLAEICVGSSCFAPTFTMIGIFVGALLASGLI